jgi:hypothetical protein
LTARQSCLERVRHYQVFRSNVADTFFVEHFVSSSILAVVLADLKLRKAKQYHVEMLSEQAAHTPFGAVWNSARAYAPPVAIREVDRRGPYCNSQKDGI